MPLPTYIHISFLRGSAVLYAFSRCFYFFLFFFFFLFIRPFGLFNFREREPLIPFEYLDCLGRCVCVLCILFSVLGSFWQGNKRIYILSIPTASFARRRVRFKSPVIVLFKSLGIPAAVFDTCLPSTSSL